MTNITTIPTPARARQPLLETIDAFRESIGGRDGGRTLAAMSGGVDSAVAAALAAQAGDVAVAVTMRLSSPGENLGLSERVRQCCGPTAYEDARLVAGLLGIPHFVVNFEAVFEQAVVDYFCAEYVAGRTPNPCVACNGLIKFGALLDFARALGAGKVVTGHYVRVAYDGDRVRLRRAADATKDQSYMLAGLRPEQLRAIVAPLGDYTKEETRQIARDRRLSIADKPDSMDLCFVEDDYREFVVRRHPGSARPGAVVTTDGRVVGRHNGLIGYTVGQRKGLPSALQGGPWFVVRTDAASNTVVIGRREELARSTIRCANANLVREDLFGGGRAVRGLAVCRYRSKPLGASATTHGESLHVTLDEPVPVATPGQLLVLYDATGDEVLASGVIEAA